MNDGKAYESLVAEIYKKLSPDAKVVQNDHLQGYNSNRKREIDVSITYTYAGVKNLIIIQVKDYSRKADVKVIDEFKSVIKDVRANKGILICNQGFTNKAIEYAQNSGIETLSVYSAMNKRWEYLLDIPVFRTKYKFKYERSIVLPAEGGKTYTMEKNDRFSYDNGNNILDHAGLINSYTPLTNANKELLSGKEFILELKNLGLQMWFDDKWTTIVDGNIKYKFVDIEYSYYHFTPKEYEAIKSYSSDNVRINTFVYEAPFDNMEILNWKKIKSEKQMPNQGIQKIRMHYFEFLDSFFHIQFSLTDD
jgi:hypothetical protein